jgi:hypothetical protein
MAEQDYWVATLGEVLFERFSPRSRASSYRPDPRDMFGMFDLLGHGWTGACSFQAIELGGDRGVANGAHVDLDCLLVPSPIQSPPGFGAQGDVDSLNTAVRRRSRRGHGCERTTFYPRVNTSQVNTH